MANTNSSSEEPGRQVEAKKPIETKSSKLSTAQITILASLLSLAGVVAGAALTGWFTKQSEEVKAGGSISSEEKHFEADLIIKAISTDDQGKALKTLSFFYQRGSYP
jgi:hypothetical protein